MRLLAVTALLVVLVAALLATLLTTVAALAAAAPVGTAATVATALLGLVAATATAWRKSVTVEMYVLREESHTVTALLATTTVAVATAVAVTTTVASTTTAAGVTTTALEAATAGAALGSSVDANSTAVEPAKVSMSCSIWRVKDRSGCACYVCAPCKDPPMMFFKTHSTSFMPLMAALASSSFEKRTKPKPRLRPVSRSLTTTCKVSRQYWCL
jgi:hypothetical protein